MQTLPSLLVNRRVVSSPVQVGDLRLRVEARTLLVRLPWGGLAWQRPTAVLIARAGRVQRRRVVDITRLLLVSMAGAALLLGALVRQPRLDRRLGR